MWVGMPAMHVVCAQMCVDVHLMFCQLCACIGVPVQCPHTMTTLSDKLFCVCVCVCCVCVCACVCVCVCHYRHPGNVAVDAENGGRLIYYDFGMMGSIKREQASHTQDTVDTRTHTHTLPASLLASHARLLHIVCVKALLSIPAHVSCVCVCVCVCVTHSQPRSRRVYWSCSTVCTAGTGTSACQRCRQWACTCLQATRQRSGEQQTSF